MSTDSVGSKRSVRYCRSKGYCAFDVDAASESDGDSSCKPQRRSGNEPATQLDGEPVLIAGGSDCACSRAPDHDSARGGLEVTSKSTRRNDQVTKHTLYESLGVAEYFLYDPRAEYLSPPLQGVALRRGRYVPLEAARLPDGAPALYSEALGLSLHVRGQALRLHDPVTGEDLLTLEEEATARGEAEARAERETADRRAVEAENARLRARIRKLERSAQASRSPQSR